ncbi:MAG TPA: GDP-L-fucose synthase [Gammaproteobacteria bacterium]|nr:GDP-L-fucose synthase [Gammaproteobacteria bacterium]HRA42911.1 GDP-L-fucose synthase [Gammaproteobacteria bacterium]
MLFSLDNKRVYVAGHNGMVGSALVRRLANENCEILTVDRKQVDLRDQTAITAWLAQNKPDVIFLAAATVGGIHANRSKPAQFLYNNLMIASNIIHAAKECGVQKLLFLGSSCIYPRNASQPITEEALLTGSLEPTNEWYAIAKIAGLKLTESYRQEYGCDFISCMPTNLYGPLDNYDLENSHVLPALLRKIHEAKHQNQKTVTLWGTGKPRREFLFVDDLADACVYLIKHYSDSKTINIGTGTDFMISELAETIAEVLGFKCEFTYDTSMPDGTPQKLLDISRLKALNWVAKTNLQTGIKFTYEEYLRRHL